MSVTSATNARPPGGPVGRGGEVGRRDGGHGQEVRAPLGAVGAKRRRRAGGSMRRRRTADSAPCHDDGQHVAVGSMRQEGGQVPPIHPAVSYAARWAVSQPFGRSTAGKESAAGRRRWWPRWPWGRPSGPTFGTRAFPSGCTPASTRRSVLAGRDTERRGSLPAPCEVPGRCEVTRQSADRPVAEGVEPGVPEQGAAAKVILGAKSNLVRPLSGSAGRGWTPRCPPP